MTSSTPLHSELHPYGAWQRLAAVAAQADALAEQVRALVVESREALAEIPSDTALAAERIATAKDAVAAVARLRHAAAGLQVTTVVLAERSEVKARDAERSTHKWLARHAGLSPSEAGAALRAGQVVRRYSAIADALAAGDITPAHAEAVANIIPDHFRGERKHEAQAKVDEAQQLILGEARRLAVGDFRRFCARVRDLLDEDGRHDPSADPSRITLRRGFNGRWILQGDLAPDFGALVATLLESQVQKTRRAQAPHGRREGDVEGEAQPEGQTPDDVQQPDDNAATDAETASETETETEPRPRSEELAEALGQLLGAGAAVGRPGNVGIFLHIELADLEGAREHIDDLVESSGKAHTELGLDLSDDALWGLMCGSRITPVFRLDGTPLAYGRSRRLAPEVLTHVLRHRDRTCMFPNCDAPSIRLQMHHLVTWEDGGPTDPGNMRGGCNGHHHDIHDRGWRVIQDAGGQVRVFRPDGTEFDPTPHYQRQHD